MTRRGLWVITGLALPALLQGQEGGAIAGRVIEHRVGTPVAGATIDVDRGARGAVTDADGRFLVRALRSGWHRVTVRAVGFRQVSRDSVLVESGRTVLLDIALAREAIAVQGVVVEAAPDPLLDPQVTQSVQRIRADELRDLPVSSLAEALALQAGVVGGSFRGGRVGQELVEIDGFAIKNQLDAASGRLGIRIPPVAIHEASLITNAFSTRYGQALSGVLSTVTKDGAAQLGGQVAFETDRPMPDGWDAGLDRLVVSMGGPLIGRARFFTALDMGARVDDDPVSAPESPDSLDPRHHRPWLKPHAAGEQYDFLGKLLVPLGGGYAVRLLGVVSQSQRELFDPVLKYATDGGSGERSSGRLATLHVQRASPPQSVHSFLVDARLGYFRKEAIRSALVGLPERRFGALSFSTFDLAGESVARARDTVAASRAVAGFSVPQPSDRTPWGVPAFFLTASPRGELSWNRFEEVRARLDVLYGRSRGTDIRLGAEYVRQRIASFTRLEAFHSVDEGAPVPTVSAFTPFHASGYVEWQQRASDLTWTAGVRLDAFSARGLGSTGVPPTNVALSPRLAVSTAVGFGTVVASVGRFVQPPDFQYLVDAAFDDTLRTGRFRRGNPFLGYETSTQYELQVRLRPAPLLGVRAGAYVRRLDGLVASVPIGFDPDSAVFGNGDFGRVKGLEVTVEREHDGTFGIRATYVLQQAEATATDARALVRRLRISPVGDTIVPAQAVFPLDFDRRHALIVVGRARVGSTAGWTVRGIEAGTVFRWSSGLPFTRTNLVGDSLVGFPNSHRLPAHVQLDVIVRRVFGVGPGSVSLYLDVRNVTNRRNVTAVRRSSGQPQASDVEIAAMAGAAYAAHPSPIPRESPRYRTWADLDRDGLLAGDDELLPLFVRAARDFAQPLFAYGIPRLVRLGAEFAF